jgi:hypothetical protein
LTTSTADRHSAAACRRITANQRFADGAIAVFVNTNQVDAQASVKITGDTGLSMAHAATE